MRTPPPARIIVPLLIVTAFLITSAQSQSSAKPQHTVIRNRAPLAPNAFDPLPLGSIEPRGWLADQLRIQSRGLTGHLDEFWPDVSDKSAWLGGSGEAWERGPYFADGLLPLAYLLHDPALIVKANRWVEWTLTHQQPNGLIGPATNNDWWPRMVMLKVLTQYAEATGDPRVVPLMSRYFAYELRELPTKPLDSWGKYRWQDNALTVLWLYNRTGDPNLLTLARLLRHQGFDWKSSFEHFQFTAHQTRDSLGLNNQMSNNTERALQAHGVNNAMALKASPLSWLLSRDPADQHAVYQQISELEHYHLLPNGMYSGDEHLSGDNPSQGVELCTVVESMFSWEDNLAILGDSRFSDRLERIAFNALPGTISDDMWSHQYDQQPNQIACTRAPRQWSTNGPDSNLFGLEPNFGCCTANMHQGWPKFAESIWMTTPDGGLVTTAYAPSRVSIDLPKAGHITIDEDTEYPFRGLIHLTLHTAHPVDMPLTLRTPGWATSATVSINNAPPETIRPSCPQPTFDGRLHVTATTSPDLCAFHTLHRRWEDGDRVDLTLPMQPRITRWYHASAAVERGPLLFSLKMDPTWNKLAQHNENSADWQLHSDTPWNYALALDSTQNLTVHELPLGPIPYSAATPPVTISVQGRLVPEWILYENSAGPLPQSPVISTQPPTLLELIPYAAAKLRITAFPVLAPQSPTTASTR